MRKTRVVHLSNKSEFRRFTSLLVLLGVPHVACWSDLTVERTHDEAGNILTMSLPVSRQDTGGNEEDLFGCLHPEDRELVAAAV